MTPAPLSPRRFRHELLIVLALVVLAKAVFLWLDHLPRFFLWDSVTYLQGALDGELPRDRSFLYSLLIRYTGVATNSLQVLIAVQTLAGIGSALLVYGMLRRLLMRGFIVAATAAVVVAMLPTQLFYERMMMAEAMGSVLWLAFMAVVLLYCRDGRTRWLPLVALAGIVSISFRLNGTITVLLLGGALPLWLALFRRPAGLRMTWRKLASQLALIAACTAALHIGYRHTVARIAHSPPGYIGVEGLFRMGLVSHWLQPHDFDGTGCPASILTRFTLPLADPDTREGQLWSETGLWTAMQKLCTDPEHAADMASARALSRHWMQLPALGLHTSLQYFDTKEALWRMDSDLGRHDMPLELIDPLEKIFGLNDPGALPWEDTLVSTMFEHSRLTLTACYFALPLFSLLLGFFARRRRDTPAQALAALGLLTFMTQYLFSHVICFRYLAPFPALLLLELAVLSAWALESRRHKLPAAALPTR